jgi:catechol 1,2-dioxygenase
MRGRLRLRSIVLLALAISWCLSACSGNGSESGPAKAAADCRRTNGAPQQSRAFSDAASLSSVRLKPGPAITPKEASREAPARRGKPLILSGTIYAEDCRTPLAGAVIDVWQVDADGIYGPGHGTSHLRCCYLQGTVQTGADGRYTIETIEPGRYANDPSAPAHIHFDVHYRSAGLLTEVFFAGDPKVPADDSGGEVIRLRNDGDRKLARFDIVLAAAAETGD